MEEERLSFVHGGDAREVELFCAHHSARTWNVITRGYCFTLLADWRGKVGLRRRDFQLDPREMLCSEPADVVLATPHDGRAASFDVIELDAEAFERLCQAEGAAPGVHFNALTVLSASEVGRAAFALQSAVLGGATRLELQSRLATLANACVSGLIIRVPRPRSSVPMHSTFGRLRELLHSSEGSRLNLLHFAESAGVSQYQLLRGFKRLYGLPPHAYEIHLRVERARDMLRRGYTVAEAAAANDFTDQSHFARHFRRIWGLTPRQYAQAPDVTIRSCNSVSVGRR